MAEEEPDIVEAYEQGQGATHGPASKPRGRKPCNTRIDELARPNRRLVLGLYEQHAHHLNPERVEAIKQLLQDFYSMSLEETEKYFEQIRRASHRAALRRKLKAKLRKKYKRKLRKLDQERGFRAFQKLLQRGMMYAYEHPIPPIITPRVRCMADVILEQICDIRDIEIPDREDTDKLSQFLISVSDWMAIAIERIYYEVQVHKNEQLKVFDELEKTMREEELRKLNEQGPVAASTPISSIHEVEVEMEETDMAVE